MMSIPYFNWSSRDYVYRLWWEEIKSCHCIHFSPTLSPPAEEASQQLSGVLSLVLITPSEYFSSRLEF